MSQRVKRHAGLRGIRRDVIGYCFLAPFLLLFFVFTILPIFVSAGYSLTYFNMVDTPRFIGFTNFRNLFLNDEIFILALKNTFIFALIIGPAGFLFSFIAAWFINVMKFKKFYALGFYAPSIVSGVAMSVIWLYFFSGDKFGLINNVLIKLGVITQPILWTMDPSTIMPVVIFVSAWMSMGTGFLVFQAGFQNIPGELLEASHIDGVSTRFQELRYIVAPIMRPQMLFSAINSIVGAFSVFDIAVQLCGMPSPNYAAHTIVAHMYDYAFIRFETGYASAVSVVLFVITFTLGRLAMRVFSSKE